MDKPIKPDKMRMRGDGVPLELWLPTSPRDILGYRRVEQAERLTGPDPDPVMLWGEPIEHRRWRVVLVDGPDGPEHGVLTDGVGGAMWHPGRTDT